MKLFDRLADRAFSYLDQNPRFVRVAVPVIAFVISPSEIARQQKAAYTARHKTRVASGDVHQLGAASASLRIAARVHKSMEKQPNYIRRCEFVSVVVKNRQKNLH